ncbi:MAG: hypothetical protein U0531_01820 [Dehalococcoidia bacterium]
MLDLGEPREYPQTTCRHAIAFGHTQGDATAWRVRGITVRWRFNETVLFRAGDPVAIRNIALLMGAPYVKITRVRFHRPYATVTPAVVLRICAIWMALRSPSRAQFNGVFPVPVGTISARQAARCNTAWSATYRTQVCAWHIPVRLLPPGGCGLDEVAKSCCSPGYRPPGGPSAKYADLAHQAATAGTRLRAGARP